MIVGEVQKAEGAHLREFVLVESEELAQFHGVCEVPKPFVLEVDRCFQGAMG